MSFGKPKDEKDDKPTLAATLRPSPIGGGTNVDAFLGKGSRVVGAMTFSGPVELDGDVEGEVHSKDKLVVGESAFIKAKIVGSEVIIRGTVTGDIYASKSLTLKKPARIVGNIQSSVLSIEEGVVFEGKCSMSSNGASKEPGKDKDIVKPVEKVATA